MPHTLPDSARTQQHWFAACLANKDLRAKLEKISFIIADVDGCMTTGNKAFCELGNAQKQFCVLDGMGIYLLRMADLPIAMVTGDNSPIVVTRAQTIGIPEDMCHRVKWSEKPKKVTELQKRLNVTAEQTLILGDDIAESVLRDHCGLLAAPANAPFYICSHADLVTPQPGGKGALRILVDLILYAQERHPFQKLIAHAL